MSFRIPQRDDCLFVIMIRPERSPGLKCAGFSDRACCRASVLPVPAPGKNPVCFGGRLDYVFAPWGFCPGHLDMASMEYREETIPDLLVRNAGRFGGRIANREKEFGIWQSWSWSEVAAQCRDLALGMMEFGVGPGDHVAVIGRNRPRLYWSMVAAQMVGAVPVPVYQDAVAGETGYVLGHSQARFVVAGDQEQVDKVLEIGAVEAIFYLDGRGLRKYDHSHLHSLETVAERGRGAGAGAGEELDRRMAALGGETPAVILYTSGTTGNPKGVVLSHRNIVASSRASAGFDGLSEEDSVLAWLPMAWVGDFIFSIGQAYWTGFCVNCPESPETMMKDLREIGPTYYFAPPRIFETILTSVMTRMEDAGRLKRRMFGLFMAHARKVGPAMMAGEPVGLADRLLYGLGELLVYGPLRGVLGFSRIRVGYTAGEAIGPEIFDFYRSLGINLKQLYGQTEASVFITQQPDGEVRADTVGVPSPGVELRIGEDGEVLYRSPGSFVEYYRDPEATAKTRDDEGWVATGDAGFLEEGSGHLRIIDRAGDVGRMQDGSLFAPKYVENRLKFHSGILEAVVFGAGRDSCAALINIDPVAVGSWAERRGIVCSSYQELAGNPDVGRMIAGHVAETNRSLAADDMLAGCQISRFLVLHKELDADDGELTRTRKLRRRIIGERYAELVEALHDGRAEVHAETEVTYEDGRKGMIAATLAIRDVPVAGSGHRKAAP